MDDVWTLSLFDDEEPKAGKVLRGHVGVKRRTTMEGGELGPYLEGMAGGAPPLDWWVIDE